MNNNILELEPRPMWRHFSELNAVPRPSKKEERVRAFMKEFGERLGLDTTEDDTGNIIIRKPASPGMEDRVTVVMQGHLDMVHQKNADTDFDFDSEGIRMFVDGDWVKADGTTLGADNGIGVASIMAILASDDIEHPPIEALFTVDEETGMTGAKGLKAGLLNGDILLNLDTEDDRELTIGCAGGVDVNVSGRYEPEAADSGRAAFRLAVKGLNGGHSGMDIHLGRANANKLLNRLLFRAAEESGLRIASIESGGLRNAIPREGFAVVTVAEGEADSFRAVVEAEASVLRAEYATTDPALEVSLEPAEGPETMLPAVFQSQLLRAVYACPNGIFRMSPDIQDLVQTSNNLASVQVADGEYTIQCLTRGSVDSEKMDLASVIRCTFELMGADVTFSGAYPGWKPRPEAPIVQLMSELYEELYGEKAPVLACHAGLECGILGTNYPEMQMISFGPNIRGAHSPDEKVQISSVQKYWGFLMETLRRIPRKAA
ncbi:MAG: aminoacyl-histidine dipeptidase [Gammaproteobacteria bacterium]|nr:aminoacyl-histidine dipeptidase [Gammaproteobacteria bacterium]